MGLGQGNSNGRITFRENLGKIREVFFYIYQVHGMNEIMYFLFYTGKYQVLCFVRYRYKVLLVCKTKCLGKHHVL